MFNVHSIQTPLISYNLSVHIAQKYAVRMLLPNFQTIHKRYLDSYLAAKDVLYSLFLKVFNIPITKKKYPKI